MGARPLKKTQQALGYSKFDQLDGDHPWKEALPEGHVPYRVRELGTGEIAYFNFALAKEIGLIPADHPHQMNASLKNKLIETFSLQIINEYDELSKKRIDPKTIKPKKYMASRYLQLQHSSKQGRTSGDGRGIWNGFAEHKGKIWDISSRGTGVTCLAPGAVEANKPLKTGSTDFGYGCGQAEIDELYGAAILAEIMHLQGIHTERVLCVIDLGKGLGIGVRAAPNLLRPAHLFLYLKQNRFKELKAGVDYLIDRQIKNGTWKIRAKGNSRYEEMAEIVSKRFAEFTATLDIDYIFAWLDWDGDNVLADAGIIDYGSVRQFGIRHDHYRYDDVERFSTNLNEQKLKARLLVQVFVQMADYLKTGKKKPLKNFAKHSAVTGFDKHFKDHRSDRLLYRMGFTPAQRETILKSHRDQFEKFDKEYSYFERSKISGQAKEVADGINHPALFNMRSFLRELPAYYTKNGFEQNLPDNEFFKMILSGFAKSKDLKIRSKHQGHIQNLQRLYKQLVVAAAGKQKPQTVLKTLADRAHRLNGEDRITGNALINIVSEIMDHIKKGLNHTQVQNLIDNLVYSHLDLPEVTTGKFFERAPRLIQKPELYSKILSHVAIHQEDI